jgi:hypothetical protein
MFIRWKERKSKRNQHWPRRLYAYIAESERTPSGPRQKTVAYLGHIWARADGSTGIMSADEFLTMCATKIAQVEGLTGDQQASLLSQLEKRIPRPTAEALAEDRKGFEGFMNGLKAMSGMVQHRGRKRRMNVVPTVPNTNGNTWALRPSQRDTLS